LLPSSPQSTDASLRNRLLKIAVTLAAVGIALVATFASAEIFGVYHPRLLFFLAGVVVVSWYAGFYYGMLASVLSIFVTNYFFFEPQNAVEIRAADALLLLIFAGMTIGISFLEEMRRRAVSEKEHLLAQLEEEKRRFEAVLQQMPAGVVIADAATERLILSNQKTFEITGYQFEAGATLVESQQNTGITGTTAQGETYSLDNWPMLRALKKGDTIQAETAMITRPDGNQVQVSINAAPIRDANNAITTAVITIEDISERHQAETLSRTLQALTAGLSRAVTPDEVADVIVTHALAMLKAHIGSVALLTPDRQAIELLRTEIPDAIRSQYQRIPLDYPGPLTDTVRTSEPIWIETKEEYLARYPNLAEVLNGVTGSQASACVPLIINNRTIGGIGFSFGEPRKFGKVDKDFLLALADQCAQALERARLYELERQARIDAEYSQDRWSYLAEASETLSTSLDYEITLQKVASLCTPRIADWCTVHLLNEKGSPKLLALSHVDSQKVEWAYDFTERYPMDLEATSGIPQVLRSGQPEFYPEISDDMLIAAAGDDEELLATLRNIGYTAAIVVPIALGGRVMGAIQLVSAEQGRRYTEEDMTLAQELAKRAALAIENARLYREAEQQREQFLVTLRSIGDAVIATDVEGRVTFINPVAQRLTGCSVKEALGEDIENVFRIINEYTRLKVESPVRRVLREGVIVGLANHTLLLSRNGREVPIDDSGAPIRDSEGRMLGTVLVFRDISERKREEQRTQLLYELSMGFTRATTVDEVGAMIMDKVIPALESHIGALSLLTQDGKNLEILVTTELDGDLYQPHQLVPLSSVRPMTDTFHEKRLLWFSDRRSIITQYPDLEESLTRTGSHALITIPLIIKQKAAGVLTLIFAQNYAENEQERIFFETLGQECADALERIQLTEQAKDKIALEERQRLARELHDAVSQSLFSATTIAQAVPQLQKINPERAYEQLHQVIALNRSAMAEMRTLLLELRPEAIVATKLPDLLSQLLVIVDARQSVKSELRLEGDANTLTLDPEVHLALYRIAQESINNILKHSHASKVIVTLDGQPENVTLKIVDDGNGFDTSQSFSGIGLVSMRERADGIDAQLDIQSSESGTLVNVVWNRAAVAE
jgi:PAS domain S-box-containing protein